MVAGVATVATDGGEPAAELDAAADELYGLAPEDFIAARDARVAQAREQGDRGLARSIAGLRRPTQAAWLANLLARHRREQLAALVALAGGLTEAQRNLDGPQLRALSTQRHQLVAAMAGQARALAADAGYRVTDAVERDLQGILEAALAQPEVAEELLAGRLARTVSYTGFGPEVSPGTPVIRAAPAGPQPMDTGAPAPATPDRVAAAALAAAQRELASAEGDAERARRQRDTHQAEQADAEQRHAALRARVVELTAALEDARREERAALAAARAAARPARESARAAQAAAARLARARARLDGLSEP